jgi:hypothetical protein
VSRLRWTVIHHDCSLIIDWLFRMIPVPSLLVLSLLHSLLIVRVQVHASRGRWPIPDAHSIVASIDLSTAPSMLVHGVSSLIEAKFKTGPTIVSLTLVSVQFRLTRRPLIGHGHIGFPWDVRSDGRDI